jgi:very-short-patch-repair endonuclease
VTSRDRIPITSVARTLFDYAEVVDFQRLEKAWEEADRLKRLRLREVERVCERGYGRHALKPIRRLLAEARAVTRTRSPLEDRFQGFCRFYDLPPHGTNVEVLGKEVDVLWPAAKLIVELDSWEFHSHRAAFQRDRARDTRLLVAGYRTARVTHDRLDREASTLAAEIKQLLATAG